MKQTVRKALELLLELGTQFEEKDVLNVIDLMKDLQGRIELVKELKK